MNIVNTSAGILSAFKQDRFDLAGWEKYIDKYVPGARELCLADKDECLAAGYSWEGDYLPVLNAVMQNAEQREEVIRSFFSVTDHLEQRILDRFGRTLEVDVILYLGLCNGAGWVTTINGKTVVLLGIEKIMELNWQDTDNMTGLIVHELGHVYQAQYGVLHREFTQLEDHFLWQLFTEGVAMVFEQEIVGDPEYYHQDTNGWKLWCDQNAELIRQSFCNDLRHMTKENQRYFGDWVRFEGHGDTGYYLGTRFVRFLLETDYFDRIIQYSIKEVRQGFDYFMRTNLNKEVI